MSKSCLRDLMELQVYIYIHPFLPSSIDSSIYLSICLFIHPSIHRPSIHSFIDPSIHSSIIHSFQFLSQSLLCSDHMTQDLASHVNHMISQSNIGDNPTSNIAVISLQLLVWPFLDKIMEVSYILRINAFIKY